MHHVSRSCAITPDGKYFLLAGGAGRSGLVCVYSVKDVNSPSSIDPRKPIRELKENDTYDVSSLKFTQDRLIVGFYDRTIKIFDISKTEVHDWAFSMTLTGHLSSVKVRIARA